MKRFLPFSFLLCFFVFFTSCGKKGPLLAPVRMIPQSVENFEASQRGQDAALTWTNPIAYKDGSPLPSIEALEIWVFEVQEKGQKPIPPEEFEAWASLEASIKKSDFPGYLKDSKEPLNFEFLYRLNKFNFSSSRCYFALKVRDSKGRVSDFSPIRSLSLQVVPLPPLGVVCTFSGDSIEVRWEEPEMNIDNSSPSNTKGYNIYRREGDGDFLRLNSALLKESRYQDREIQLDTSYSYLIRASSTESPPFAESSDSGLVEVEARDIFPPASPSGVVAAAGGSFITLSWDENSERDLLGYRIWRREEGEEDFTPLTPEAFLGNSFTDSKVEKKRRYYYAITAQDRRGNESQKSEIVSAVMRDSS